MTEPLLEMPAGGWTVDDLDAFPESNRRYEFTDGALTVSPSPSSLHQALAARLRVHLEAAGPTKPALYARYGIPRDWRIELRPPLVSVYGVGQGDCYQLVGAGPRLSVSEPFTCDVAITELLPRWAGRGEGPTVPEQGL